jgi:hypothetical protein
MDDQLVLMEGSSVDNNVKHSFREVKSYKEGFNQGLIYM